MNSFLLNFSDRTTFHGISRMYKSKSCSSRVFWMMIMLLAFGGFSLNTYQLIVKFLGMPILTNFQHEVKAFSFPEITICNLNPIYFPPRDTDSYTRLTRSIRSYLRMKQQARQRVRTKAEHTIRSLADYMFINRNLEYSHPGWSFIVDCEFNGGKCSWRNFDVDLVWPYGNCFTFKSVSAVAATRSTDKPVVTFTSNSTTTDFSAKHKHRIYEMMKRPYFQVLLYKSNYFPAEFSFDWHGTLFMPSGIFLMLHNTNTRYQITESHLLDGAAFVKLKLVHKMHSKTSGYCSSKKQNISYINYYTNKPKTYLSTWVDCINSIIQRKVFLYCQCLFEIYPIPKDLHHEPFCKASHFNMSYLQIDHCVSKTFTDVFSSKTRNMLNKCFQDPCDHYTYHKVIYQAKYPAVVQKNTHRNWLIQLKQLEDLERAHFGRSDLSRKAVLQPNSNTSWSTTDTRSTRNTSNLITIDSVIQSGRYHQLNIDFVEKNFMMLHISPTSLFMDLSEETMEYPLTRLLGDVGGNVGLWLGASVISFFELIYFFLEFVQLAWSLVQKHRRKAHLTTKNYDQQIKQEITTEFV